MEDSRMWRRRRRCVGGKVWDLGGLRQVDWRQAEMEVRSIGVGGVVKCYDAMLCHERMYQNRVGGEEEFLGRYTTLS